jgi:ABC-2 type transport system ATP-binding protein
MIKIDDALKMYGYQGKVALNHVSLEFNRGEIVGLLGENGAGKTTLMKSIFGFVRLNSGEILLDGEKIGKNSIERLAFATSEHSFFGGLTGKEQKTFYQNQFPRFNEKRFDSLLEFFELSSKVKLRNFSTGQKNQFEVILALSQGADYIFMDEPFAGNDIFNREDFYKVLLGILDEGECLVLSTHLIEEIKNFIGRAVLLHKGSLIRDITTVELEDKNMDLMGYIKNSYSYKANRVMEALMKNEKGSGLHEK